MYRIDYLQSLLFQLLKHDGAFKKILFRHLVLMRPILILTFVLRNCSGGSTGMLESFVGATLEDFYQLPEDVFQFVQLILSLLAADLSLGKWYT
jgi:hypothetical protein